MNRGALLAATLIAGALTAGVVVAQSQQDTPREAQPAQDPIAEILRETPQDPAPPASQVPPPAPVQPTTPIVRPGQPGATPATPAAPIVVTPPPEAADGEDEVEDETEEATAPVAEKAEATPAVPGRRQRRPVAIVQAIDKVTAETMRFEVEVGGRPVRFNRSLIFTARACEVSAPDEPVEDSVAYLEVSIQPRGVTRGDDPRQIFRGWMFASSPGLNGLEHPIYDAWVVGCKA